MLDSGRWRAVNELDELVARVRARGPQSLPLDGWDRASVWGWDEAIGSLYAHLRRNTDDPARPPAFRIGPDDYTPAITLLPTLAQYIAMAADCDPWRVLTILDRAVDQDGDEDDDHYTGTVVTLTEGHSLPEWPYRPQP
jgi:hypothetical protein